MEKILYSMKRNPYKNTKICEWSVLNLFFLNLCKKKTKILYKFKNAAKKQGFILSEVVSRKCTPRSKLMIYPFLVVWGTSLIGALWTTMNMIKFLKDVLQIIFKDEICNLNKFVHL
ncbi:hypothetical protein PCK1_002453, partial [Pneumocystis canis]